MCEKLHVLPQAGALLDQDAFFVYGMNIVIECRQAKEELDERERSHKRPSQRNVGR